jgi:hypothetical protein
MHVLDRNLSFARLTLAVASTLALLVVALVASPGVAHAGARGCAIGGAVSKTAVCQQRLSHARHRWPDAALSISGHGRGFGRFIIPNASGDDFQELTVAGSVTAGLVPVTQSQSNASASSASITVGSDRALLAGIAGSCGDYYTVVVNPSVRQLLTTVEYDTTNYVQLCYQAWTGWVQPHCWGSGQCQPPQYGVIGQHSWQTNPWDNQTVFEWGCCTYQFFLRVVVDGFGTIGWYAGQ